MLYNHKTQEIISKHWTVSTSTVATHEFAIAVDCSDNMTRLVDTRNYTNIYSDSDRANHTRYAHQVEGATLEEKLKNWVNSLLAEEEEKQDKIEKAKNSLKLEDIATTYELTGKLSSKQEKELKKYTYNQYIYRAMGSEMFLVKDTRDAGTGHWFGSDYIKHYTVAGDIFEISPYLLEKIATRYNLQSARQILFNEKR